MRVLLLSLSISLLIAGSAYVTGAFPLTGHAESTPQQQSDDICLMMPPQSSAVGDSVLQDVDVTNDKYYSSDIGSGVDLDWLDTPGLAWKAAEKDAQALQMTTEDYITTVRKRMVNFMESKIVFDRDDIYTVITSFLNHEEFYLVCVGGKCRKVSRAS